MSQGPTSFFVRLLVTPISATMVLAPRLLDFGRLFPDVVLEVATTQEGTSGARRGRIRRGHPPLIVDDADLMIRAAIDGLGLTFSFEEYVAPQLESGALVRVLEDWCPPFAGYFLYYPSRRQQPAALSALIETLRL